MKNEAEEIIHYSPEKMQKMLQSVYHYNSSLLLSKNQEELLLNILFTMSLVDRKFFVKREGTYDDNALPIGAGQTISQPSTVARILLLAEISHGDDVLEVGTGSGWNASLLAFLAYPGKVMSIDRIYSLIKNAKKNISEFKGFLKQKKQGEFDKFSKLTLSAENILDSAQHNAKYDKIIITAGIKDKRTEEKIEEIANTMLKKNGILICPRISGPIIILKKQDKLRKFQTKESYVFVPLLEGKEK